MQGARKLAHYVAREITRLLASRSALIGADHAIGASCIAPIGQTNRAADGFRRRHRCGDPGLATGRIRFAGQRGALIAATNGATSRRRFCACRGSAALRKSCSSGVIPPTLRNASASRRLQGCCPEAGQGERRPRRALSKSRRLPARVKKRGDSVRQIFRDESQNLGRLLKNSSILADASGPS